jgi:predicted phage tail protein
MVLDEDMVPSLRLGSADLHIMPEISGGKRDGLMKAILGVTLLVASGGSAAFLATPIAGTMFGGATWAAAMGQVGLAMALAGVSSLLTPQSDSSGDDEESFVMSGPKSSYGQGKAIQIIYGEIITGGMLISGGVDTIGLQTVSDTYHPNTDPESVADTSASFQTAGA